VAEPVEIGVVVGGAGAEALLAALGQVREARLIGICGPTEQAVRTLAAEHKTEVFPSLKKLLEVEALDLAIVASRRERRGTDALAAVKAGKPVWLVPPLPPEIRMGRLAAAAEGAGVRLGLGLTARHHPAARALRKAVAAGSIGRLAMVRYSLRLHIAQADDGLATQLAEAIDLAAFIAGKPAATVFAARQTRPGRYLLAHLALADNAIGTVEVHAAPPDERVFPPREQFIVVGTNGTLRAGTDAPDKLIHSGAEPLAGHAAALRMMLRHVRGDGPPPTPHAEADAATAACLAAERSAETGQPVALATGRAR